MKNKKINLNDAKLCTTVKQLCASNKCYEDYAYNVFYKPLSLPFDYEHFINGNISRKELCEQLNSIIDNELVTRKKAMLHILLNNATTPKTI